MKTKILFLIYLMSFYTYAQNCKYHLQVSNFVGQIQNNQQASSHSLSIYSRKNNPNCRHFRIFFGKGNANSYNRKAYQWYRSMNYNIYAQSALNTILKDFGDAGSGEYLSGTLSGAYSPEQLNFYFKLVSLDSVFSNGTGYFTDLIPVSIYSVKSNGQLVYQASTYMNVNITIPTYAELSLGAPNSGHDPSSINYLLDLGVLSSHKSGFANLSVKGNVGFRVYMSSQEGGRLVNNNFSVPYSIKIGNGNFMNLSSPGQMYFVFYHYYGTSVSGESFPIEVKVGNLPSHLKSGDYTDNITVTIQVW